jgi:hypothetical protein
MENSVSICCDVACPERFSCAQFARAMDVNAGKIINGYYIIEKCNYEKAK